ncbi:unnamed protein product [Schistosoma margrebowiei]|uniref:Uncharacterized protein n=1 Tax=Schistosoma margrebowiei TaxID=48269 RepID=A0A183LBS3_9TREM|nr:unnamed protein product [Schistosoma margrebowiei]
MESSRSNEERKIREHITQRNGDIYEKNEQKLARTKKEGQRQRGFRNAGRWFMFHWGLTDLSNNNDNNNNNSNNNSNSSSNSNNTNSNNASSSNTISSNNSSNNNNSNNNGNDNKRNEILKSTYH